LGATRDPGFGTRGGGGDGCDAARQRHGRLQRSGNKEDGVVGREHLQTQYDVRCVHTRAHTHTYNNISRQPRQPRQSHLSHLSSIVNHVLLALADPIIVLYIRAGHTYIYITSPHRLIMFPRPLPCIARTDVPSKWIQKRQ